MFSIRAKGTVQIYGVDFEDQQVIIEGKEDNITRIEYGEETLIYTIDALKELIRCPQSYYAEPEKPKPNTLKAAYVAIYSLWKASDIVVNGKLYEEEPHAEGRIY